MDPSSAAEVTVATGPENLAGGRPRPVHPHFLAEDARDFLALARHAARSERGDRSLYWYRRSLRSWRRANENSGGRWQEELEAANREYRAVIRGLREKSRAIRVG